jgi:hypothetical protein
VQDLSLEPLPEKFRFVDGPETKLKGAAVDAIERKSHELDSLPIQPRAPSLHGFPKLLFLRNANVYNVRV